jgi:hypothetical protein
MGMEEKLPSGSWTWGKNEGEKFAMRWEFFTAKMVGKEDVGAYETLLRGNTRSNSTVVRAASTRAPRQASGATIDERRILAWPGFPKEEGRVSLWRTRSVLGNGMGRHLGWRARGKGEEG